MEIINLNTSVSIDTSPLHDSPSSRRISPGYALRAQPGLMYIALSVIPLFLTRETRSNTKRGLDGHFPLKGSETPA
jgi:hypothetical protein